MNGLGQRLWRHRRRLASWAGGVMIALIVVWLGLSLWVGFRMTGRARPPFIETPPPSPQLDVQSFELTTIDGETIGAWLLPGASDRAAVLLVHGNGGQRASCWQQAVLLHEAGYPVLLISCRAHGASSGEQNDFGFSARHDVAAAVRWLKDADPERPVVVWGASLGSAATLFAMPDIGPVVDGVILECPYRDLDAALWNRLDIYLPQGLAWVAYAGLQITGGFVLPHRAEIAPLRAITDVPDAVPVLILAGARDERAPAADARLLQERISGHCELVVFEEAGHLELRESDPEEYRRVVLAFLERLE